MKRPPPVIEAASFCSRSLPVSRARASSSATSSLTRIEPVSPLAACARERAPSRSLATRARRLRGCPLPPSHRIVTAAARSAAGIARIPSLSRGSAPSDARHPRVQLKDLVREARGVLAGGVSRSKRLARAVVVCARGSMRVSELAAEEDTPRRPRAMDLEKARVGK